MAGIGSELNKVLEQVKDGGKIAYPNGVEPLPKGRDGVKLIAFDGRPSQEIFDHLNELIETGNFKVEISRMYAMEGMVQAMKDVQKHHIGKLALGVAIGPKGSDAERMKVVSG